MSILNAPKSAKPPAKFNWTKIHLVYLALAGFDLLAIGAGLTLSSWSKAAHQETIVRVNQTNFLRDHLFGMQAYALQLEKIQNDAYTTQQFDTAERELNRHKANLKFYISEKALDVKLAISAAAFQKAKVDQKKFGDAALSRSFKTAEAAIRKDIDAMLKQTAETISAMKSGYMLSATESINKTNEAFNRSLQVSLQASNNLDAILRDAVAKGLIIQSKADWYHNIVGGGIGLMILLACGYAHTVGKLLRKKYKELQTSNEVAENSHAEIQKVNDEITKLNVDLAANLKALKDAQDSLIKKGRMEQLGQLTATVAHELRNPLGAVRTSAYLMERKLGKNSAVEQQLLRISNGIMRCDNIITQLLDFSRTTKVNCNSAVLDDWLESVIQEEAEKLPAAINFTCNLQLDKTVVPFDPTRLQRAIINLLSNASEAMVGDGSDPAKFACAEPHIIITSRIDNGEAIIEVTDNGPGIPLELMEKVRDPLFTTKSFGTGLGIPAIEQIAKQHGGSLDIQSSPGKGATFAMRLPINAAVAPIAKAA